MQIEHRSSVVALFFDRAMLGWPRFGPAQFALALIGLALVGGCGGPAAPEASDAAASAAASNVLLPAGPAPVRARTGEGAETSPQRPAPSAASVASLGGLWRVVAVDGGGKVSGKGTARGTGSLLEIAPEQLAWSYRADPRFPADDLCERPYIGPLDAMTADRMLRPRFAAALERLRPSLATELRLGATPHEVDCRDGGRWGPGQIGTAHLYQVGPDRLMMSWYDDRVLLLERQRRPAPASGDQLPARADDFTR